MSAHPRGLHRFWAVLLLAWFVGSTVAAPLAACCATTDPCCVAAPSGAGCTACAATSGLADASRTPMVATPADATPSEPPAGAGRMSSRPWKPPD